MKIAVISSAALPAPAEAYAGLENVVAWCALRFAEAGHDVTMFTTKGSEWRVKSPHPKLEVFETIEPSWSGDAEIAHFLMYRDLIQQEYTKPGTVVWDNTWLGYTYLIAQSFPDMKLLHTHHGMLGFTTAPEGVRWPRFIGISRAHAQLISTSLGIPARHVYNGIPLPEKKEYHKGDYLLSLNRISREKGIHDALDVAMASKTPIKIVGDDTKVSDHRYVREIIDRCLDSGGLAEYHGLVDNDTKVELLQNCRAVIGCIQSNWVEGFGLWAVEAMAYGKPVLCTANGGLTETVLNNETGFIAGTSGKLTELIPRLDEISPEKCRARAEEFSIDRMAQDYLSLFEQCVNSNERW